MLGSFSKNYEINDLIEELEKTKIDTNKLDKILASDNIKINAYIDKVKKTTLLHKFMRTNSISAIRWLLENQANPYTEDDYNLPAFFYFIHSPNAKKILFLLEENNVDFNFKNSQGRMILQDIVINGDIVLFNRLVQKVKQPFSLDDYGRNILFDALSSGDKEIMPLVFDHEGANLDIQDNNKDSLLHFVKDGNYNLLEFLLKKGVSPNLQDEYGKNIIFYFSEKVEKSNTELDIKKLTALIELALEAKDSTRQKDKDGNNLLTSFLNSLQKPLSQYNQKEFLSKLIAKFIDCGVDINEKNADGNNPILLSVDRNDLETVELLIEKDADVNVQNAEEVTPLALAVMKGNNEYFDMVQFLLSSQADPNIKDANGLCIIEKIIFILMYTNKNDSWDENISTPFDVDEETEANLQKFNEDDYIRNIFELMVYKKMIDFKSFDSQGLPYFYILVITENNYLASLLFRNGASINQPNAKGQNILEYYLDFAEKNKIDEASTIKIMQNIIKLGLNLDHRDEQGATILHNTLLKKSLAITKNIIIAGGSIDVVDKKGRTLLHNAIWANDFEKVKFILGVKKELVNVPDKLGIIPINYAAFFGNKDLVIYLIGNKSYVNNLHPKKKSTLDFFKRFHKNIFALENEEIEDPIAKKYILTLTGNMRKEFNIVE